MSFLSPRDLTPITDTAIGTVASLIDVIILSLTILFSILTLILLFFNERKTGRSVAVRTKILSLLILSDLMLGIFALPIPARTLVGNPPKTGEIACTLGGFFLQFAVWTRALPSRSKLKRNAAESLG